MKEKVLTQVYTKKCVDPAWVLSGLPQPYSLIESQLENVSKFNIIYTILKKTLFTSSCMKELKLKCMYSPCKVAVPVGPPPLNPEGLRLLYVKIENIKLFLHSNVFLKIKNAMF